MRTNALKHVPIITRTKPCGLGRTSKRGVLFLILMLILTTSAQLQANAAGELLVKWKHGPASAAAADGNARIGSTVKRNFTAIGWQLVELPPGLSVSDGLHAYAALETVGAVEPNGLMYLEPPHASSAPLQSQSVALESVLSIPNDPLFSQQWYLRAIAATNAWAVTTGGTNIVVAVLDRGVNYNNPDLAANMWRNPGETGLDASGHDKATNGIDDDGNGYVDDVYGADVENGTGDPRDFGNLMIFDPAEHGTFCAGIIGAVGNNGTGIAGLNWQARIMAVRFAGGNAANTKEYVPSAYWSDNLAAWDYVVMMKRRGVNIRVCSSSNGDYYQSVSVRDAIAAAGEENILCVFSGGNQGANTDLRSRIPHGYNLPHVIGVAASIETDTLATFSNFGASTLDLAAPGINFVSTWGDRYTNGLSWSGTSFACPLVAGTAALLLSVNPNLSANDLIAAIRGSVDQPSGMRGKLITNGRLNVGRALEYLTNADPPAIVIYASPTGQWTATNAPIRITFNRAMNRGSVESRFVIEPTVSGTFVWADDNRSFSYEHEVSFDSATNYTVRLSGSAQDESGGTLDGNFDRARTGSPLDDFVFTFRFRIPNDDFANAQWISASSGSLQSSNRFATFELLEPDHLGDVTSMSSIWYRWTPPGADGWFTFELTGATAFDSVLAVYTGDQLDHLVSVAGHDNYGTFQNGRVSFSAVAGTNYSLVVAGKSADATKRDVSTNQSGPFTLAWHPTAAPVITNFSPTSAYPGQKVTLNGTDFTGATNVLFNGARSAFQFSTNAAFTDLQLTATVPTDGATGPITIETPHGNFTTTSNFTTLVLPRMTARPLPGNLVELSWPSTTGFNPQRADSLSSSSAWVPASFLSTRLVNSIRYITVTNGVPNRFFRLYRQ
jgi:thermitase